MNEAIYRSPNWLRRLADFEIRTGKDIDKSKEPTKKRLSDWDKRWKQADEFLFKKFFAEVYSTEFKKIYHSYILDRDLQDIRKKYRGDFEIWDKFDAWLVNQKKREEDERQKKEAERQEQKRLKKELDELIYNLISDFKKAPYQDKASTPTIDGEICFKYIFEDNSELLLKENKLIYKNTTYTLGLIYRNKFVELANNLFNSQLWKSRHQRPGGQKKKTQSSSSNNPKSNHPKWELYQNLKQTVLRREDQLKKMSKNDPDRASLENEYKVAKAKLDKMKNQYQFEHLVNFQKFNKKG